jgi:hypothetical protein
VIQRRNKMKKKWMMIDIVIEDKVSRKKAEKMLRNIINLLDGNIPGQIHYSIMTEKEYLKVNPLPKEND